LPSYHLGVASLVAATDEKWVDNLLSRFEIPGVEHSAQGSSRRLSVRAIHHIALVRRLVEARFPTPVAVELAQQLLAASGDQVPVFDGLQLNFDRARFLAEVDRLLAHAVESHIPPRRGRPTHRRG